MTAKREMLNSYVSNKTSGLPPGITAYYETVGGKARAASSRDGGVRSVGSVESLKNLTKATILKNPNLSKAYVPESFKQKSNSWKKKASQKSPDAFYDKTLRAMERQLKERDRKFQEIYK